KGLEDRTTTGLAAMGVLAALARQKEEAVKAASESDLSPRAFAVFWTLKDDARLRGAGVSAMDLAQEAESLLGRFPNAAVNADENRRLRAALYQPLLRLHGDDRGNVVESIVAILLGGGADADA
ncbi:MAG: hypothetical protein OXI83_16775, partial [Gemmatimonadota bacterium]|nr:hypothetical protein [Gemmatimonadota bacterium]